jgi:hypothetical protein
MAAEKHCEVPYGMLTEQLLDLGLTPPAVQLMFMNPKDYGEGEIKFAGLKLESIYDDAPGVVPSIPVIQLREHGGLQECIAVFDPSFYDPAGMGRFLSRFCGALDTIACQLDPSIGELLKSGAG